MSARYVIQPVEAAPDLDNWDSPSWTGAETLGIECFRPESSDHRPGVKARLMYGADGLYGMFEVNDRYVRCVQRGFNVSVCQDSCVEFFVQPFGQGPYFNFEFNCGGALLCFFITDPTRTPNGFVRSEAVTEELLRQVAIRHSLPEIVDPEMAGPVRWTLGFYLPFALLERYVGPIEADALTDSVWRANFYKCGDKTSHPHWAGWQAVPKLNFHLPEAFGEIVFG